MSGKPGIVGARSCNKPTTPKTNNIIPCPPEKHHLYPRKFEYLLRSKAYDIDKPYNLVTLHRCTHRLCSCRGRSTDGKLPHDKGWQTGKGKDWPKCSPGVHTNSRIPTVKNNGIRPNQIPKRPNNNNWIKDWTDLLVIKGVIPFPTLIKSRIKVMRKLYKI